ncbi:cytochrome c biogenesis protein ResB [Desulfosarcina sp. OttesenSCG-928-A07]|nr:cytochrome c biogenesis protein ResB [Desulfosarcina sp. OttesenSCG-928-G17]MDL2328913.1 cytochrome c biogenesis protein ResB [Desulfosarcina sp. OttesenSCG-928-A07]
MKTVNPLWNFFISIKLTVVLLLSLAMTSIIGTVLPQNKNPQFYEGYGPIGVRLIEHLNLFDMYHAWWFQGLLLLLMINIVVCSINRLQKTGSLIWGPASDIRPDRFVGRKDARTLDDARDTEALIKSYEPLVRRWFPGCQVLRTENQVVIYGEKGRWSRLGVYIVHLSVILLLVGGLVGSFFGFEGFVTLPEGETTDTVHIHGTGQTLSLDFQIRCDRFSISRYENGMVKEYRSSLTLLENGAPVLQKDIIVNDPLRYRGINIFQSSYGKLAPQQQDSPALPEPGPDTEYHLHFLSKESGMTYTRHAKVGVEVDIPEGLGKFLIVSYEPQTDFHGRPLGPALKGILTPMEGEPVDVVLPIRFPGFDRMRSGDVAIAVIPPRPSPPAALPDEETRYYTGLQVTRDPGVGLVYAGFALMIIGCFVSFYLSHQQVCVVIDDQQGRRRVTLSGIANRNKISMQHRIEKIFGAMTKV